MQHLLNIYNKTKNRGTGYPPIEMKDDEELEAQHIIRRLYQVERRRKITDFNLKKGTWCRYIIPRDPMKKARYKVSVERYVVSAIAGNAYELMAADGSTKQMARWRLLPLTDEGKERWKIGTSFPKGHGQVLEILARRNEKPHGVQYKVKWRVPHGAPEMITWTRRADLRWNQADKTQETPEEKAFNDAHTRRRR
jgi:hypothetical protein